jgi:dihydrofolate reductase
MKVVYHVAASLDGYIATNDHQLDWLFELGAPDPDPLPEFMAEVGAVVMGRNTLDWITRALTQEPEPTWPYSMPTFVATSRPLEPLPGADVQAVSGAVEEWMPAVAKVAADRLIWLVGGGNLAAAMAERGLLHQMRVTLVPVCLGEGIPLFPRPFEWRTVSVSPYSNGMVEWVLEPR